jgi:hypothetical protein
VFVDLGAMVARALTSVGLLFLSASADDTLVWKRSMYGDGDTSCTGNVTKVTFDEFAVFGACQNAGTRSNKMGCNATLQYPTADCSGEPDQQVARLCAGEGSTWECVPKTIKVQFFKYTGSTTCSGTAEPAKLPGVDSVQLLEAELGACLEEDGKGYKWTLTSGELSKTRYSSKGCSGDLNEGESFSMTCDRCTTKDGNSHHLDCGGTMVLDAAAASGATNMGPSAAAVMAFFSGIVVSV